MNQSERTEIDRLGRAITDLSSNIKGLIRDIALKESIEGSHLKDINITLRKLMTTVEKHDQIMLNVNANITDKITTLLNNAQDITLVVTSVREILKVAEASKENMIIRMTQQSDDLKRDVIGTVNKLLTKVCPAGPIIDKAIAPLSSKINKMSDCLDLLNTDTTAKNKAVTKFLEKVGPYVLIILSAIATYVVATYGKGKVVEKAKVTSSPVSVKDK